MVRFKVTGDYTCMGDRPHGHMAIYWFDSLHLYDLILCEMYPQNARHMSSSSYQELLAQIGTWGKRH